MEMRQVVLSSEDKASRVVITSQGRWLGHTRLACDSGGGSKGSC
jgi:hypothetical protein